MNPAKYSSGYLVAVIVSVLVLNSSFQNVEAELTPPYFNLAEGRQISATATCGVGTDGPELYCKLVGANTEHDNTAHKYELIQGQVRDILLCYPKNVVSMFWCLKNPKKKLQEKRSFDGILHKDFCKIYFLRKMVSINALCNGMRYY